MSTPPHFGGGSGGGGGELTLHTFFGDTPWLVLGAGVDAAFGKLVKEGPRLVDSSLPRGWISEEVLYCLVFLTGVSPRLLRNVFNCFSFSGEFTAATLPGAFVGENFDNDGPLVLLSLKCQVVVPTTIVPSWMDLL